MQRLGGSEIDMVQFLSLFQEYLGIDMVMQMEQILQVLPATIGMSFYCQNDEQLHHMLLYIFVDNNFSTKYANGRAM